MERKGEGIRQEVQRRIARGGLELFDDLVKRFYSLEVLGQEHLASVLELQQCFRRSEYAKPIPMIVYFNHIAGDDPFLILELLDRSLGDVMGNVILPVSDVYMKLHKHPTYAIGARLAQQIFGFDVFPITQAYRRRGSGQIEDTNGETITFIDQLTQKFINGGCLVIAPEGHRSPGNSLQPASLQPAEESIGVAVRRLINLIKKKQIPEAIILPIGIEYPGLPAKRFHLGLKKVPAKLSVGQPLLATEILENVNLFSSQMNLKGIKERVLITDYLMMALSNLLPPGMRGVYDGESTWFRPTLEGRAKLVKRGKEAQIELVR